MGWLAILVDLHRLLQSCKAKMLVIRHSTAKGVLHAGLHRLTAVGVSVITEEESEDAPVLCV